MMTTQLTMFDAPQTALHPSATGKDLKQLGQERALENENDAWREAALGHLKTLAMERKTFTSDEFRQRVLGSGMLHPHHGAVWGGLFTVAVHRGWIENSGRYENSILTGNHCRKVPRWVSMIKI